LVVLMASAAAPLTASAASPSHGVQASCLYKSTSIDGKSGFRLKRVVVQPPTTFYGRVPDQVVGWKVVVQRKYPNNDGPTSYRNWKSVFVSRLVKTTASPDRAAVLDAISARIGFVSYFDAYPNGVRTWFRTLVKFYRFTPEGAVESHSRYRPWLFDAYRDGSLIHMQAGICDGAWLDSTTGGPPEPH
jgi:hypothetical protein